MKFKKSVMSLFPLFIVFSACSQLEKVANKNEGTTIQDAKGLEREESKDEVDKYDMAVNAPAPATGTSVNRKMKNNVGLVAKKVMPMKPNQPISGNVIKEPTVPPIQQDQEFNTEEYDRIYENPFLEVLKNPLSTFSIDVDTASYANLRRFIKSNSVPPKDAVRIEEMINYFSYDYPQPEGKDPFSINVNISDCPWKAENKLLHIGLQGKKIDVSKLPPSNIVFLIDTSGSMSDENKLPLLKESFKLLVNQMRENDKVSIVTYAGSAGVVLEPTSGDKKEKIIEALDRLESGGSTAGGEGIELAYKVAEENLKANGNNRVVLATDGDFNVGPSSDGELVRMIEEKRKKGVFLSVLGLGMGNYKDSKMEQLADKGNGNYGYIDTLSEAKKIFVKQMGGTLFTIAKDVKLQLEFNPTKVKSYRLIGYENRVMRNEDFNDDKKDAGELGSGHSVTALYEVVPADGKEIKTELKYQDVKIKPESKVSDEFMTVKFRYKAPNEDTSKLIVKSFKDKNISFEKSNENLRFSSAVAGFGLLLRDSEYKGSLNLDKVIKMATTSKGDDSEGYRSEFIELVKAYKNIKNPKND
jgi:Ca-activated chloride channel family protein